jgi:integrase
MHWDELDLKQGLWTLPATRAKNGERHHVPLTPEALALLPPRGTKKDTVFGEGENGYNNFGEAKRALDDRIEKATGKRLAPWTHHDLRRSTATHMATLGIQPHIVEALLNHRSGHKAGVKGIYNRATYDREVRQALLLWASHLQSIVSGGDKTVVPMRRTG